MKSESLGAKRLSLRFVSESRLSTLAVYRGTALILRGDSDHVFAGTAMNDHRDKPHRTRRMPSEADPAEAVERIVPRRHLIIEDGDVLIVRTSGGFRADAPRSVYQFRVQGHGLMPERFAAFEHVAVEGERLAETRKVRLFFQEVDDEPPFLLRDFRPPR